MKSDVQIGYLHRGFEKSCENSTWTMVFPYTDRLNYVSPMLNNVGYGMAVEQLLGIRIGDAQVARGKAFADFMVAPHPGVPQGSLVLGDPTLVISLGAQVEPGRGPDLDRARAIRSGRNTPA